MNKWDKYFTAEAELASSMSKDRSTQVGACIVGDGDVILSKGWNGFPRGVDDEVEERHERPAKYMWTEHAERNAIYNAARHGIKLDGATLYLNTLYPCADCARAIIQAGIKVVYHPRRGEADRWLEDFEVAEKMFDEAGVEVIELDTD